MPPVLAIVGQSRSGKTTLIEKLIPELKRRGFRVGVVKHTHHQVDFDKPGKDTHRHKAAGADAVILACAAQVTMVKDADGNRLDNVLPLLADMDIIIAEGYKRADRPKIEVLRQAPGPEPVCRNDPLLKALVTDTDTDLGVPRFGLDDIGPLADFICALLMNPAR